MRDLVFMMIVSLYRGLSNSLVMCNNEAFRGGERLQRNKY